MADIESEIGGGRLVLKYDGDIAEYGELDAYDLSDALAGFADFTHVAGMVRFGDDFDFHPTISTFKEGSFDVEFVLHLLSSDAAGLLYASLQAPGGFSAFVALLADSFNLLKHLNGEKPASIERQHDGSVNVTNNNGVINNYSADTLIVVSDPKTGRAARKFVGKPLERSATQFKLLSNGRVLASATREQAGSFVPSPMGEVLAEHSNEVHLTIKTAVLEGRTNWKFNDGQKTFSAPIEDADFLSRVDRGREAFRRGDELIVRMRSTQKRINGQLKAEHAIEKVLQHTSRRSESARLL